MAKTKLLGPWIRRFLIEYLITERNFSRNTQQSYRDTFVLLLPFIAKKQRKKIDELDIEQITPELVRSFLQYLEDSRHCKVATRNQRLSAIFSLATFISEHSPEHVAWCGEIRSIPIKKTIQSIVPYLEKIEMDTILAMPNCNTKQGQRDYAILLFLYNTGARASEVTNITISDLNLIDSFSVKIIGKGNKVRYCPLWKSTVHELQSITENRKSTEYLFLNRYRQPFTRFGIYTLVERYGRKASVKISSLKQKRVSPHSIRHTTAVHLLRAGVDINTIRAWLGHVSLTTTNIYAEVDLEMKSKALSMCEIDNDKSPQEKRSDQQTLVEFLDDL